MRRFDKTKKLIKANLLVEQRYLLNKGLLTEDTFMQGGMNLQAMLDTYTEGLSYEQCYIFQNGKDKFGNDVVDDFLEHFDIEMDKMEFISRFPKLIQALQDHVANCQNEAPICSSCNGSGEGMYDGSTCRTCKGSGEAR